MKVLIIVLCTITWVLLALYIPRRRLALTSDHPDKPYDTSDHYVIGGRWGFSPLTGELGYESYKFADAMTAIYMCAWLNNANDHRSLGMAFFDWAAKVEAMRLRQERRRKADLVEERAKIDTLGRRYCEFCRRPVERTYLPSDNCPSCELAWHQRQLVATYRVPGAMMDVVRYVPGLDTEYPAQCNCGTYLKRGSKARKRGTCDACDYRLTFGVITNRAVKFTASSGPR